MYMCLKSFYQWSRLYLNTNNVWTLAVYSTMAFNVTCFDIKIDVNEGNNLNLCVNIEYQNFPNKIQIGPKNLNEIYGLFIGI